jgi:hypothetical protein
MVFGRLGTHIPQPGTTRCGRADLSSGRKLDSFGADLMDARVSRKDDRFAPAVGLTYRLARAVHSLPARLRTA